MFRNIEIKGENEKEGTKMMLELNNSCEMRKQVVQFMNLFRLDKEGMMNRMEYKRILESTYFLLVGQLDEKELSILVDQELESVEDYICSKQMSEWLVELSLLFLQEVSTSQALQFLSMLFNRITNKIDITKEDKEVDFVMKVTLERQQDSCMVFSEEKVYSGEEDLAIYEYRLGEREKMVKSGQCVEKVICEQFNGKEKSLRIGETRVEYCEKEEMKWEEQVDKSFMARVINGEVKMSPILDRPQKYSLYKIKNKQLNQYFNLFSHFHSFTDYPIDLIDKLQNKSSSDEPQIIKKTATDLKYTLIQENKHYVFSNDNQEQESGIINFGELVSEEKVPEGENKDTIVEDLREYGSTVPHQILVIGDLKTGKSSVAKGLATKLDLVYVEPEELLEASFKRVLLYEAKEDTEEEPEEAILNTDSLVDNVDLNVVSQLRQGKRVDDRLIILLLNRKLKETTTIRKGFVLDLPFYIQQLNKQQLYKDEVKNMLKALIMAGLQKDILVGEEELALLEERRQQRRIDLELKAEEDEKQRLKEEADALKKKKAIPKKKKEEEEKVEVDEGEKNQEDEGEQKKPKMQAIPIEFDYFFSNYVQIILNNRIALPKMKVRYFSHVVDLREDDDNEILFRASNTLERILLTIAVEEGDQEAGEEETNVVKYKTSNVYSQYDRAQLLVKKVKLNEDDEDDEPPKVVLKEQEMAHRPNESKTMMLSQIHNYRTILRQQLREVTDHMKNNIVMNSVMNLGNTDNIVEGVLARMMKDKQLLRPLADKLEAGSGKELVSVGLEEGSRPLRRWSKFQQLDVVELKDKKRVVKGKVENTACYADRLFVFENEVNMNKFLAAPREYVSQEPVLTNELLNIALIGPRESGKKTLAMQIKKHYDYRVVDLEQVIQEQILLQKGWSSIPLCNPVLNQIHINAEDYKEANKGKGVSVYAALILFLHSEGVVLKKKVKVLTEEEQEEENKRLEDEKKKAEEQAKKKSKSKKDKEVKEVIEDLKLTELTVDLEKNTKQIKGVIFINYPTNEEHVQQLKDLGIEVDRVVILQDNNEDAGPFAVLSERIPDYDQLYNIEEEQEAQEKTTAALKEQYAEQEDKVIDIQISNNVTSTFNRVQQYVDPFIHRVEKEEDVRVAADVQENEEPILFGEFGKFCPVRWNEDNQLVAGKEEFECYVQQKKYRCFSEKELNKFKQETHQYLINKTEIPPMTLLLVGLRGAGVKTQLKNIYESFNLRVFDFQSQMLQSLQIEKEKRRKERYLARGFKAKELDEDGKELEEQDAEILEEKEDFDAKQHEAEVYSSLLSTLQLQYPGQGYVINGNFMEMTEEVFQSDFGEMLEKSGKLPEVIVVIKASEDKIVDRLFDHSEIQKEFNRLAVERKEKKDGQREERRIELIGQKTQEAQDEGNPVVIEEIEKEVESLLKEEEGNGEDEEEVVSLEEMIREKKEKLKVEREGDQEKLDRFVESMSGQLVQVETVDGDKEVEQVFTSICYKLRDNLSNRHNIVEREQCMLLNQEQYDSYEQSYVYRKSQRVNTQNIICSSQIGPQQNKYLGVYRDRLYYFSSQEERKAVLNNPSSLLAIQGIPDDLQKSVFRAQVAVIGYTKSGKSTLSKQLATHLGLVRIKISHLVREAVNNVYSAQNIQIVNDCLNQGLPIPNALLLQLILQRLQQADCIRKGFVLDGFPSDIQQAQMLNNAGIQLDCVFHVQQDIKHILKDSQKRSEELNKASLKKTKETIAAILLQQEEDQVKKAIDNQPLDLGEAQRIKQGVNRVILTQRVINEQKYMQDLSNYFCYKYRNLQIISSCMSEYGMVAMAKSTVKAKIANRIALAQALVDNKPVLVDQMGLTQSQVTSNLSSIQNVCPVTFNSTGVIQLQTLNSHLVYFNKNIYMIEVDQKGQSRHLLDFLQQPNAYLQVFQNTHIQHIRAQQSLLTQLVSPDKLTHLGYDLLVLQTQRTLQKGLLTLQLTLDGKVYAFANKANLKSFQQQPSLYKHAQLPLKLPIKKSAAVAHNDKALDPNTYLDTKLSKTIMKVLAQLGQNMLKYPSLSIQETSMKFIALALKANNQYRDAFYRNKYKTKLDLFVSHCNMSDNILKSNANISSLSDDLTQKTEQQNLYQLAQQFQDFNHKLQNSEKTEYFDEFIN